MPKQVRRSFGSCWTCRRRRVACDGAFPACLACKRLFIDCQGYNIKLVWVNSETGLYETRSRRTLDPLSTWAGFTSYNADQLRHLVEADDLDMHCECPEHTSPANPFRVLGLSPYDVKTEDDAVSSPALPSSQKETASSPTQISPTPSSTFARVEGMLLHHYVDQVAFLLMPVDAETNPWRSVYPSIAMQQSGDASRSLYNALLSQSAFHLSVLNASLPITAQQYKLHGMKHYLSAIGALRASLNQLHEFEACAASLYTLAQIEGCYSPELKDWRKHFLGLSGLLHLFSKDSPWSISSDAWVIAQSLALSYEIAHTASETRVDNNSQVTSVLLGSVSQRSQFGYTIGASCVVIQSIARIRQLAADLSCDNPCSDIDVESGRILGEIGLSEPEEMVLETAGNRQIYLNNLHRRLFKNATIIYLFRSIYNVAPSTIQGHVSQVLRDTIEFLDLKGGSVSLWPVFVAAVETSTPEERTMANQWLDYSHDLGISNRRTARAIVEEVWNVRDREALLTGMKPEDIVVDWRKVQSELKIDILLL